MAEPGIKSVAKFLPEVRAENSVDLVIAQAENVTDGKGMSQADMKRLKSLGIDFFTGGNHTPAVEDLSSSLADDNQPVIGPGNMTDCPGKGWKYITIPKGKALVISVMGSKVGKQISITNPLLFVDGVLRQEESTPRDATIVNFHGDYSSEKKVAGYYLDGRVSAVIGDHWHIPTADAMVLPKGTAHITDVGMCGVLHSSLGVKVDTIVERWRDGVINKNELETSGPLQFNAVLVKTNPNGLAESIIQIQKTSQK